MSELTPTSSAHPPSPSYSTLPSYLLDPVWMGWPLTEREESRRDSGVAAGPTGVGDKDTGDRPEGPGVESSI